MDSQENLDKWINSCINHYNKKSNTKMKKTIEEKVQQLEQAHSRLFNNYNTLHQDFTNYRNVMIEELSKLQQLVKSLQPKEEEIPVLPDTLINGKEYKAVITEIIKYTNVIWKDIPYTNWELKIEGKDKYVYVAFIPTENQLKPGDKVRFIYTNPFQLRKLKLL